MASPEPTEEPATAARFRGLADIYAKNRPTYPAAALDFICARCELKPGNLLIDVGSGTGISSRLFATRSLEVIGVEPGDEMRAKAEAEPPPDGCIPPTYIKAGADEINLPTGSADGIVSAQAFHWFNAETALREFRRLLRPAGWVALIWNERSEADPFTAAVTTLMHSFPEAQQTERHRFRAGEPLLHNPLFPNALRTEFPHEQVLDRDGLIGRMQSVSYAPREGADQDRFVQGLDELFAQYQQDGHVTMHYVTTVYLGQRE